MNKENIKIGLLGVIAVTLMVNTYYMSKKRSIMRNPVVASTQSVDLSGSQPAVNATTPNPVPAPQPQPPKKLASESRAKTSVQFSEVKHSFGQVKQDSENKHVFSFTNTGNEPLIIENAVGSCGCTVPNYPKEPIAPGKSGEIEVVYKPGKQQGKQQKTVTVTANTQELTSTLTIDAEVLVSE